MQNSRKQKLMIVLFILFGLNMLNKRSYVPEKLVNRKNDVSLKYAYEDIDSIYFEIPNSYLVEFLPENKELKTK